MVLYIEKDCLKAMKNNTKSKGKNIWITGIGIISALGTTKEQFFYNMYRNENTSSIIEFDGLNRLKRKYAVTIPYDITIPSKWIKYGKGIQWALLATQKALSDARIEYQNGIEKAGICLGSMLGQVPDFQKTYCQALKNNRDMNISDLCQFPMEYLSDIIAKEFHVSGIRELISMVCVSGSVAIGTAYQWIQRGRADIVICGGVDTFYLLGHQIMSCLGIISPDNTKPFDESSKGFVLGEGAGIIILESEEHARKRVTPYCEIAGYGNACDAFDMSLPDKHGTGLMHAIRIALNEANESEENISFINSHGVGTKASDESEICALRNIFGSSLADIPIYSIKGSLGHTSGAAGAINLISAINVMLCNCVPPTVNYNKNNKFKDLTITCKPLKLKNKAKCCISNTMGFGGLNTSLLLRRSIVER